MVTLLLAAIALHVSVAQVPIPSELPGYLIGHGTGDAKVQLETYIDPLCPFSKAAYEGIKTLADYYKPEEIRIKAVLFPLPFHQHSFTTAESVFTITSALGDNQFTPWLETLYENQERFENKATKNYSAMQVTNELKELAKNTFPALTDEQWDKGMTGYGTTEADQYARVTWKYACTRTVTGTPQYKLNGVPFDQADSSWNITDWRKVIDPLLKLRTEL